MRNRLPRPLVPAILGGLLLALGPVSAQQPAGIQLPPDARRTFAEPAAYVPDLPTLVAATSELRDIVQRFSTDRQGLLRFYTVPGSVERRTRLRAFQEAWLKALPAIDFAKLSQEGKADYVLLRTHLEYQQALLGREERNERDIAPLVPFAQTITRLAEDRQKLEFITADAALAAVQALGTEVEQARASLDTMLAGGARPAGLTPAVGVRASQRVDALRGALQQWFAFYNGYDPAFTEKVPAAYQDVAKALTAYSTLIRQKIGGLAGAAPAMAAGPGAGGGRGAGRGGQAPEPAASDDEIVGDPIGREGLLEDLAGEMIPYTPEQLIEIGNREYAWCEAEMKKASRELGFGDDWLKALEAVKNKYVPAGGQPALIRNLALEAGAFLKQHDLVTVPPLASDIWRMQMMSPERQRVNPFFTGGETISVSYPTNTMTEEERLMSMRGNGVHVSRATVQHELIPGHHLQGFMAERYEHPPRAVRHAVLHRGLGALLGIRPVGQGLSALGRGPHRHAVVAHAPRHADHLLAELPPRPVDAGAVHRLPRHARRPRAVHRHRRSAPIVRRQLLAALPGGVHARRAAVARPGEGSRAREAAGRPRRSTTPCCGKGGCRSRYSAPCWAGAR